MAPYIGTGVSIGSGALLGQQAYPSVFALGDSQTEGLLGDTGGWRARMQTPITWVGPYTDPTGLKHGGRGGDSLVSVGNPDMNGRIASQWAATPAQELWICGGTNDFVVDVQTYLQVATDLDTLLDTVIAAVDPATVIRVLDPGTYSTAHNASRLLLLRRRIGEVVASKRATGAKVYFHHVGGHVSISGLDSDPGHPLDTSYGVDGYGLWAQWMDRWINAEPISPATLSPKCWFRNPATTYNASTGAWTDESGNGYGLSPQFAGKPTLVTGEMGVPALQFSASPLRTATWTAMAQPVTMMVVASALDHAGTTPAIFDGVGLSNRNMFGLNASNQPGLYAGTGPVYDTYMDASTIGHVYFVVFNGANSQLWVDGSPRRNDFSVGAQQIDGLTLMGVAGSGGGYAASGEIYEFALFPGALTEEQIFGLSHHCRAAYGLWPLLGGSTSW